MENEKIIGVDDDGNIMMRRVVHEEREKTWIGLGRVVEETEDSKAWGLVFYTPWGPYYIKYRRPKRGNVDKNRRQNISN
jgi:hypothetical protein